MIVNIGLFFDKLGVAENLAYSASKAAVAAITRCLAVEWARDKIRVVNVPPGYIETDLNREWLATERPQS
jgi:NAD(P)-dependent dehydrogenase (short-subunit alcohol dehydrogenase family)